jgi:hypothetical protein
MFSGVLSEGCLPGGFLFTAEAVSLKFLTHNSTVLRLGTLVPMNIEVATKHPLSHDSTEPLFLKHVSTAKAQCCNYQCSMVTEML